MDKIRNKYIRGTAQVEQFGHVQRRQSEYTGERMLKMELPGRRRS